jgi:hypothetical protein
MGAHLGGLLADLGDIADLNPDCFDGIGDETRP